MSKNPHVLDVTIETFESAVLRRSMQVPVLVDFWAPWCGPCRTLGPILEKLAAEKNGAFVLAKINTEEEQEIAYQFGVQGIPNCVLIKNGQIADQFVGAEPEAKIRAFLEPHLGPVPGGGELLGPLERAKAALEAGDRRGARMLFEKAAKDDDTKAGAALGLARLALAEGDLDAAEKQIGEIPTLADEYDDGQVLQEALRLAREAAEVGDRAACEARLQQDSKDLEACYALGGHAVAAGEMREALEHYLAVAQADCEWKDQAGRRAMVAVFNIVGARHDLSEEFREKLRRVYY